MSKQFTKLFYLIHFSLLIYVHRYVNILTKLKEHDCKGGMSKMTNNQVNYARQQEDSRHNVVSEVETNRSNVARESETNRHNLVTSGEINRHNLETEQLGWAGHYENARRNIAQEDIGWGNISVGSRQASAAERSASANWLNAQTNEFISGSTQALNYSRATEARAKAGYTSTSQRFLDDQNAQAWSRTVSGAISDFSDLSKFINPLSGLNFGR